MFYAFMICKQSETYSQKDVATGTGLEPAHLVFDLVTRLPVEGLTNWAHPATLITNSIVTQAHLAMGLFPIRMNM